MDKHYPRDLVGYGAHPPRADWPFASNNANVTITTQPEINLSIVASLFALPSLFVPQAVIREL